MVCDGIAGGGNDINKSLPKFDDFQKDRNGRISQESYSAYWKNHQDYTAGLFSHYDKDHNGLDDAEFNEAMKDLQSVLDKNGGELPSDWNKAVAYFIKDQNSIFRAFKGFSYLDIANYDGKDPNVPENISDILQSNEKPKHEWHI